MSQTASGKHVPSPLIVRNISIIHPEKEQDSLVQQGVSVLIKDGLIAAVDKSVPEQEDGITIDGTGKWLLPGYVDTHVHFFQSANPYTRPDAVDLTKIVPYAEEDARNHARLPATLRTWLACGVTSVMDMGGPFWNFSVRDMSASMPDAPRVLVTGPLFSMVADPPLELNDPPIIKVSSVDEVRSLAERQLEHKPDYLKVWFISAPGDDIAMQSSLVSEVARLAHGAGIRLAVHATELETAKAAMKCGADILVHSVSDKPVDDEFLQLAKDRHIVYEPTLYVPRGYPEVFSRNWTPTADEKRLGDPQVMAQMRDMEKLSEAEVPERIRPVFRSKGMELPGQMTAGWKTAELNLLRVWNSGITITLGTDAGNIGTLHGPSIFREMAIMSHAGLTPAEILRCATTNGARAMGLENETGRVAPGYCADLVILNSNPLEKIGNASDISAVIRAGRLFSEAELITSRN